MFLENNILKSLYGENELITVSDNFLPEARMTGDGKKGILVLLSEVESTNENITFLSKVFKAIGVDLSADTHLVKVSSDDTFNISTIRQKIDFSQIFFFGIAPKQVGFNIATPKYRAIEWLDYRILAADGLTQISGTENLKRVLWGALERVGEMISSFCQNQGDF